MGRYAKMQSQGLQKEPKKKHLGRKKHGIKGKNPGASGRTLVGIGHETGLKRIVVAVRPKKAGRRRDGMTECK